jgi:hypothetical protein
MGRYLLLKCGLPRRNFGLFANCATPAFGNPIMRSGDATTNVHFHQFCYRINPDKTLDSIWPFGHMTAATGETQAKLHERGRAHCCPES